MNEVMPFILTTGTFGLVTGFLIGYAFKKVSKIFVLLLGIFLIGMQLLAYNGIITIDWLALEQYSNTAVGENGFSLESFKEILLTNIPFASTAIVGFLLGLKKG